MKKIFVVFAVFAVFCVQGFSKDPNFKLEGKSEVLKSELVAENPEKDVSLLKVKEIVQSLQNMTGIQYYSNGDKKWETLYHACYFLDSFETKNRVEPTIDENIDGKTACFYQKDNSFGDCFYNVRYTETEDEIAVFFVLADYIKYGPIKAIKPGDLKISFVVKDLGESYDVCVSADATFAQVGFLEKRIGKSIANRVEAIKTWFLAEFK